MLTTRRISQIIFFALFILLFLKTAFPYNSFIPADIFLRSDPLIAVVTMLTTKEFMFGTFIIAFIILLLTLFLGRFFCGWICPFGTMIDFTDRLKAILNENKKPSNRTYRSWKYIILTFVIIAAIFSIQLLWFFDPLALITRTFTISFYPLFSFFVVSVFNLFANVGIFEDEIFTVFDFLRNTILPIDPLHFKSSIFIFFIVLTIFLLTIVTKRFWCRYLCPLGALYGIFSKYRFLKRIVNDKCIDCGLCYRNCKMDAINDDYRTYSQFECIECMNCVVKCPTNAFEYKFNIHKSSLKLDLSRRRFILSGIGGIFAVGVTKSAFINKNQSENVIRPPGSMLEAEFLDRCIRCHECIKICSTTGKYLQPAFLESGWEGIWTPMADARHGYCEFDCILCGKVCPTGAIKTLDLQQKQKTPIGTAYFDKSRCIPWYKEEDCIVCEEHCPTYDKAIKFEVKTIEKSDGTSKKVKFPYVVEELCIGCGICVTKCPVVGKAGIFVTSARQQRWFNNFNIT